MTFQNNGNFLATYRIIFYSGTVGKVEIRAGDVLPRTKEIVTLPTNSSNIYIKILAYYSMTSSKPIMFYEAESERIRQIYFIRGTANNPMSSVGSGGFD